MERLHVGPCIRQNKELVLYALWDPQPVKADECISDVVTGPQTIDKTAALRSRLELVTRYTGRPTSTPLP